MRITAFGICILVGGSLMAAEPAAPTAKLLEVKKIWDQAPHNAFTDLIRFRDRWYCTFREGAGHASGAGKIRVLVSDDGQRWESSALLAKAGVDLRDPKISLAPEGRLMLICGAAEPASRDPVRDHYSLVGFSRDGKEWSQPQRVLTGWHWLWRVTWHKGTAYGVAYQWDPSAASKNYTAALYKSTDGLKFDKVTDFRIPNPTEATLAFDNDTMLCLQRRDGKPNTALLGSSQAPYTEWTWQDLGVSCGGPNIVRLPDRSWWAAGRLIEQGQARTIVGRVERAQGKLQPMLTLPSGGDNSYPGLVWHGDQLWISYYSSHEGKSSIYLARVQVPMP